jgi:hypothetical protein
MEALIRQISEGLDSWIGLHPDETDVELERLANLAEEALLKIQSLKRELHDQL